jgi:sterol desaturase/sphingolipid hydroxylase (fatty acid hydroxylase superfamily)
MILPLFLKLEIFLMSNARHFLWTIPQPAYVFGSALLVATSITWGWMDADLLVTLIIFSAIPLVLLAERIAPKRRDWLLNWRDLVEDSFWVFAGFLIWFPLYDEFYDTPISDAFAAIRDSSGLPFSMQPSSTLGLLFAALVALIASEFIGYWAHRVQHRYIFFWRIHATHHHITKMSVARADRTHPLEFLALNLGGAIALALLGASSDVVAVYVTILVTTTRMTHANLPLQPGIVGYIFNTPQYHQLHHSCNYEESNTNFGCVIILWDRLFGTFSGKEGIENIGNGTGKPLSILTQLSIPFRSNDTIRKL